MLRRGWGCNASVVEESSNKNDDLCQWWPAVKGSLLVHQRAKAAMLSHGLHGPQ